MPRTARFTMLLWLLLGCAGLLVSCSSTDHRLHTETSHGHEHGPECGHLGVRHESHVDYLHDGHLHHVHASHVDEHVVPVTDANPAGCTTELNDHRHGQDCGHPVIPHGDHQDYLVDGRLHHAHGDHCDDHGSVEIVR